MHKDTVKGFTHRISARYCRACGIGLTVQKKKDRGKGLNMCVDCMRNPKVYPRCKGVNRSGKPCGAIALYQYDEETNSGFCTYHKGD